LEGNSGRGARFSGVGPRLSTATLLGRVAAVTTLSENAMSRRGVNANAAVALFNAPTYRDGDANFIGRKSSPYSHLLRRFADRRLGSERDL